MTRALFTRAGTAVFPLGLGGAGIGSNEQAVFFGRPVTDAQALETVQHALARGINLIDTSPAYGDSERRIGLALRGALPREQLLLSTKAGTHPLHKGYSSEAFKRSIDASLHTLGTDYLDIVHIHDPSMADFATVTGKGGGLETLCALRDEGVIRHIGLGVRHHTLHRRFMAAGFGDVILPYLDYNLLNQSASALLTEAAAEQVFVMLGSPLCMGLLGDGNPVMRNISHYPIAQEVSLATAQAMYNWCVTHNSSLPAFNYQFIRQHPATGAVIVGAASAHEIDANLAAWHTVCDDTAFVGFCKKFSLPAGKIPS